MTPSKIILSAILLFFGTISVAHADTASDLQAKIDASNASIAALDTEIAGYQTQLTAAAKQADSLNNTLNELAISKKQLAATIALTQNKITATNLEIDQLNTAIGVKQTNIDSDRRIIVSSLQTIREIDDSSLVELLLSKESLADSLAAADNLATVQSNLTGKIADLTSSKKNLEGNVAQTTAKKAELVKLTADLSNQRKVVLANEAQKNTLLAQTKNSEAAYKKLIAAKQAQEDSFSKDILQYEESLHLAVSQGSLPTAGSGVLSWPLDKIRITQYFGNTDFATKNPQIYNGAGHTGVDFGAALGTPVKAALDGVVAGVGNTDLIPGCYSYGKWVMIKHPNGLSTLYAHLSLPTVAQGQTVSTGDIIGYSGATGYATGPHLHFGVYATAGVVIKDYVNSAHCKGAVIPLADLSAYLNPLSYLPH